MRDVEVVYLPQLSMWLYQNRQMKPQQRLNDYIRKTLAIRVYGLTSTALLKTILLSKKKREKYKLTMLLELSMRVLLQSYNGPKSCSKINKELLENKRGKEKWDQSRS